MFSAAALASTSRMLFVAVTPFTPIPDCVLDTSSPTHTIISHPPSGNAARAEDEFELIFMPRASESSARSTRACKSTASSPKSSADLPSNAGCAGPSPGPGVYSAGRASAFASAVSLAKRSAVSRTRSVLNGAMRRRPYLHV